MVADFPDNDVEVFLFGVGLAEQRFEFPTNVFGVHETNLGV